MVHPCWRRAPSVHNRESESALPRTSLEGIQNTLGRVFFKGLIATQRPKAPPPLSAITVAKTSGTDNAAGLPSATASRRGVLQPPPIWLMKSLLHDRRLQAGD